MSEQDFQVEEAREEVKVEQVIVKGERGEIGLPTAALTMKLKWHMDNFTLKDSRYRTNHQDWVPNKGRNTPSLKQYARQLAKAGDLIAKEWLANKRGLKNQHRTEANIKAQREAAMATKTERHKKSANAKAKSKTTSEAPGALPKK